MPIVSYAAVKYFTENIPIETTITEHIKKYPFDGIYDFAIAKKSGSQFSNMLLTVENRKVKLEKLQKSIRYFISKSNKKIFKVKEKTDKELISLFKEFKKGSKKILNEYKTFPNKIKAPNYELIREIDGVYFYVIESDKSKKMWKKEWKSYSDVMVGRGITLFNSKIDASEYEKIDYDFYILEAQKLIDAIEKFEPKKKEIIRPLF